MYTYSKGIKDTYVTDKVINDERDISKIDEIIQNLTKISGVREDILSNIGLRTNPKNWIRNAIKNFPTNIDNEEMKSLLFDFTESMQTRMREDFKYALIIVLNNQVILCHSKYGQKTITPEWKTIPRMLDVDNILRFVIFYANGEEVKVKYWEHSATNSFIEWLGLTRKQVFQLGGKFRIISEFEGVTLEFQLTEDELENWLENYPEFSDGEIKFKEPLMKLTIQNVKVGNKQFNIVKDFVQFYEAEKFGIPFYQEEYERIVNDHLPLLFKYIDDETKIIRIDGENEISEVNKDTPYFDILFVNEFIELRASYGKKLAKKFVNKENLMVFHAGMKFKSDAYKLGNLKVFNSLKLSKLSEQLSDYYNETNIQDSSLDTILQYVILKVLAIDNKDFPVESFFNSIAELIINDVNINGCVTKTEDVFFEYKSREIFTGKNDNIISLLVKEIKSKILTNTCVVIIIGIEDDGSFDPIPSSRLNSNRVETIKTGIEEEIPNIEVFPFQINQDNASLVLMVVFA